MIRRPSFWLFLLLAALPPARAHAIRVERISHFSISSGRTTNLEVAAGRVFIKLSPGTSLSEASASLTNYGFAISSHPPFGDWHLVYLPDNVGVAYSLSFLKGLGTVSAVTPDMVYRPNRVPNDTFLTSQYALTKIQAYGAWEYETGASSRVTVAVIDTGIDNTHPEFLGKFTNSVSQFCDPGADKTSGTDNALCVAQNPPTQACYHGTAVAGVAAALGDNAVGIAGLTWFGKLVSMKVFRDVDCTADCGSDYCGTDDAAIADALLFLASKSNTSDYGKIVANLSLGSSAVLYGTCSNPLQYAVNVATTAGVLIFAAAGNSASGLIDSPADCLGVTAVGATDEKDELAYFSNTDLEMITKGVTAPGVGIYTTTIGNNYATVSGTSFSSPMTAGLAALMWAAKPTATAAQIRDYIFNSADDLGPVGPDRSYGYGRINALKAMRLAAGESAPLKAETRALAYPNPFRPKVQRLVTFSVPAGIFSSGASVKVYTAEGEKVRSLDALAWDGKNENGADVASGIYIFRVKTDKDSAVGKLALIR